MKKLNYLALVLMLFISIQSNGQSPGVMIQKSDNVTIEEPDPQIVNLPTVSTQLNLNTDRLVFWVYGLGGNNSSWDKASYKTELDYKINKVTQGMGYSSYSLASAGASLREVIDNASDAQGGGILNPGGTNFIISHSQGGLVSKAVYKNYFDLGLIDERKFGGIVTFGTPHQGAQILNNVPDILDYIGNSCNDLAAGPIDELWEGNWFLSLLPDQIWEDAVSTICEVIEDQIVPFMMQDYLAPITEDYYVGSPYLDELNDFDESMELAPDVKIQKVAFYGVEEDPAVWRLVYSILNDVNIEDAFQANDDFASIDVANNNMDNYYAKYLFYKEKQDWFSNQAAIVASIAAVLLFVSPLTSLGLLGAAALFNVQANQFGVIKLNYYKGWQWFINVEEVYLTLIGANRYERISCECECLEKYGNDPTPIQAIHIMNCNVDENCSYYINNPPPNTNVIWCDFAEVWGMVVQPNDGVVLQESAQDYRGADNGPNNLMENTNHIQMRNNSELKLRIKELMLGSHGLFFFTPLR